MDDLRRDYDSWHESWPDEDTANAPWHELAIAALQRHRALLDGGRLLEIGCGRGGFTRWLEHSDLPLGSVIGADFSTSAVKRASAIGQSPKGVFDIQSLPINSGALRAVVSLETLEHLPDPTRACHEINRVLESGGLFVMTTPNYMNTMGLYRGYLRLKGTPYTEVGQPINRFTSVPRSFAWLRDAGFVDIEFDGIGHYRLWPGRSPLRIPRWDKWRSLTRFTALHTLFVARKP